MGFQRGLSKEKGLTSKYGIFQIGFFQNLKFSFYFTQLNLNDYNFFVLTLTYARFNG